MSNNYSYIEWIQDNKISIYCCDRNKVQFLNLINAKRKLFSSKLWIVKYENDKELAEILTLFRDAGFLFSYDEHGWCPSSIFQFFRERGLLTGKFVEIFWRGSNKIETKEI